MKIVAILFILFFNCSFSSQAQKHDYQWLFGYGNSVAETKALAGGVTLDFNYNPAKVDTHRRLAGFDMCNTSFCDKNGELLFYSNGTDVYDARDSIMMNGDSINYGWFWKYWMEEPRGRYEGLRILQSMLSLPSSTNSYHAYIFHFTVSYNFPSGGTVPSYLTDVCYYSIVNTNENFGFGKVQEKNVKLSTDTLSYSNLSAVKHGNGKDWWILRPYYNGNGYYKFLLRDSMKLNDIQFIGPQHFNYGDFGTSCFSPDGEKYFWVNSLDGIRMFDFDRCNGQLGNPQIIPFPFPSFKDSFSLVAGIAVSPNNRFLYVVGNLIVLQYDLFASDIGASVQIVGRWDGEYDPFPPLAATFFVAQSGPDGKIYINSTNSTTSLHVINRPDEPGDSCLFVHRGVKLNTFNVNSMPNFPNYRLGKLAGSPCDTITGLSKESEARERVLKVFPNPAADVVTIDYGFTDWSKPGEVNLEIINELGQLFHHQSLPQYSGFQKLNVATYPSGIYTTYIKRNNQIIATSKFAKQ